MKNAEEKGLIGLCSYSNMGARPYYYKCSLQQLIPINSSCEMSIIEENVSWLD